ncbi:membrane-targeted effector domain-containing toxin [Pseudomonas sp. BJa5]|uniref:membrane-targeted effector domain-containing toxin n=1 Tax=Pseudomonas sp. BJa5 TaxID=2936270 RepID=UPI002559973E|nr:membrane-targeted effector domain-containing toxin [Pseudomonas sp. BGr12]MDL2420295.1 membrane-targeted effector domain-containing toxin [Pseudomonas sp. BGr12]
MNDNPPYTVLRDTLSAIASRVVQAFPDLHVEARATAVHLLEEEGVSSGDPDRIYWHRFSGAASNSRSYSGWEHFGVPDQSMTLTELVMRRFRASDQDNADLLGLYGGFYTDGPEARRYDEHNEVRLEPRRVLDRLWALDFAAGFHRRQSSFWQEHGVEVRILAKLSYVSEALQAGLSGQLDEQQLRLALDAVDFDSSVQPLLEHFKQVSPPQAGIRICALSLGGQRSSDVLWLKGRGGLQLLYLPGCVPSFQGFDSERAVIEWLFGWLQVPSSSEQLLAHFTAEPEFLAKMRSELRNWAQGSVDAFARQVQSLLIEEEVFTWLCDSARQRMGIESDAALRTNAELRTQMWIGYLGVATRLLGALAPLCWPLAVLPVVTGSAGLALSIEQAIDGDNAQERHAGVLGAILSGVELVLNLPFLLPLGRSAAQSLDALEGNAIVNVLPAQDGALRGISTLADGGQYVEIGRLPYRVRYDSALQTWLIVPQDNPFAFSGVVPIALDDDGQWVVLESLCLRGGGQCLGGVSPAGPAEVLDYSAFEVPMGSYEVPPASRPAIRELLKASNKRLLSGDYYMPGTPLEQVKDSLDLIRLRLRYDARAFFAAPPTLPLRTVEVPTAGVSSQRAFIQLFDEHPGVVIGESHSSIASKQWLMNNFKPLYDKGVRTLYLEHLMTDLHQADLDLFSRTGRMSRPLQRYLEALDAGHGTDITGRYSFLELVRKARASRITVQGIDCVASYRLDGLEQPGHLLRQKVMSFYANRIIAARQSAQPADKWVALVGNSHSNLFKGVPGIAELQGVPGLRVVDAGPGQATNITVDPGEYFLPSAGKPDGVVRADLRLALQTRQTAAEFLDPATAPPGVVRPRG